MQNITKMGVFCSFFRGEPGASFTKAGLKRTNVNLIVE